MAIPSRQDFADFATAQAVGGKRLEDLLSERAHGATLNEGSFTELMCELDEVRRKHWDEMGATAVMGWMDSHPTSSRAFSALIGNKKAKPQDIKLVAATLWARATDARTAEDFADSPLFASKSPADRAEIVATSNLSWSVSRRLNASLHSQNVQRFQMIMRDVATAFRDYFHSDRYLRMAEEARCAKARVQSVRDAIGVILEAEDASVLLPIRTGDMGRRVLQRLDASLSEYVSETRALAMPVRRLDATARERALAYDLWACFFARQRSSKAKAIYYFMEFEGVERPIDLRSLERMTAEWKAGSVRKTGSNRQPSRV